MEVALVLMREVAMMALLLCLGVYTKKSGMFTVDVARKLSSFLLAIVLPVMLINTFQRDKKPELMGGFWAMLILSFAVMGASAAISTLVFRPGDGTNRHRIGRLAIAMPNCGFMGIPLLLATTGEASLLYCTAVLGVFQLLVWCWGVPMMEGKRPSIKQILINPGVAAFAVGMILFLLEIRLPALLLSFMSQVSSVNTPLSMLMIGIFLADIKLSDVFNTPDVYKIVFWRNLAIPFISLFAIYVFGLAAIFGRMFALTFEILISCSSAASAMLLPLRIGEDSAYASKMIAASTSFSLITLPLVIFVAEKIL